MRGIPAASEDVMVARDLVLAQLTGAVTRGPHLDSQRGGMVDYARRHGLPSPAKPRHTTLARRRRHGGLRQRYKMKPPLRSVADRLPSGGIAAGAVTAIATDHAPHPGSEKMQEFERCRSHHRSRNSARLALDRTIVNSSPASQRILPE